MKKIRKVLQVLLFINFFIGMANGMKIGNLFAVLINGAAVLISVSAEKKEQ